MAEYGGSTTISGATTDASRLLQAITDATDDAILSTDLDGVITSWNPAAQRLLGYSAEEAVGRTVAALILPAERHDEAPRILTRLRAGEKIEGFETQRRRKDGSLLDLSLRIHPVRDDAGAVVGLVKIARDISERRRAERSIRELSGRIAGDLSAMTRIQQLSVRLIETENSDSLLADITEAALELTGAARATLKAVRSGELRNLHERGTASSRTGHATQLYDRSGHLVGVLELQFSEGRAPSEWEMRACDVLGRMAADLIERSLRDEATRSGEERLAMAVEGAGMGTWDVDTRTGRARWSVRHFEMLGYPPDPEAETSLEMWLSRVHPDDLEDVRAAVEAAAREGGRYVSEHRIIRADNGRVVWLAEYGQYLRDSSGNPYRFVGISFDISARKRGEQLEAERTLALSRSQRALSQLVERAPFGVYIVDSQFRIAQMNRGSRTGAFREVRPVLGRDFAEALRILWPEEVAARIEAEFRHTLETGDSYLSPRFMNQRQDFGTVEAYEWEIHRMLMPDGEFGVICYFYDATEIRKTEVALRESESRYRTLAEQVSDGIFICDAEGRFLDANTTGSAMFGCTHEELLALSVQDLVADEEHARLPEQFERINAGAVVRGDWRLRRRNGTHFIGELVARRLPDGRLQSVLRDITERKAWEEQLRAGEERLRLALETGKIGTWDWDLRQNKITWTDSLYRIHGLSRETFGGSLEEFTALVHRDDLEHVKTAIRRSLREDVPYELTMRSVRPDGTVVWVYTNATVIRENGQPVRMLGATVDISELKQVEHELIRANQDLEQFAYSASHDLQEPVRTVKIFSELLAKQLEGKLAAESAEFLRFVREGSARMETLVRDLLAYTQISAPDKMVEPADAAEAIRLALTTLAGAVAETGARVIVDPLPLLPMHTTHLQQVFQNLIGNAIKYRREGVPPEIRVSAMRLTGHWKISVADNGIGIEPEFRERIFGLFKRLHTGAQYSGTGIGLALCQRIVERYHGRIWVESEPGQGSTFCFILPV